MLMDRMESNEAYFRNDIWLHYNSIKKMLYTLTLDSVLTDDLAQDTMFLCWRKIETVRKYKNLKAALVTIARNEFKQHQRNSRRKMEELIDPQKLRWLMCTSNIEEYIRHEGDVHEFLLLFSGVKLEYIQIVLLAHYYDFSMKEIAKLLHKNYNTVVSQHARGLEEMRKKKDLFEKLTRRNA